MSAIPRIRALKSEIPCASRTQISLDDEPLLLDLQGRLDDPREAPCPVQAGLRQQLHRLAIADHAPAVAVIFDFVNPVGAGRHCLGNTGLQYSNLIMGGIYARLDRMPDHKRLDR